MQLALAMLRFFRLCIQLLGHYVFLAKRFGRISPFNHRIQQYQIGNFIPVRDLQTHKLSNDGPTYFQIGVFVPASS